MVCRASGIRGCKGYVVAKKKTIDGYWNGDAMVRGRKKQHRTSPFHRFQCLQISRPCPCANHDLIRQPAVIDPAQLRRNVLARVYDCIGPKGLGHLQANLADIRGNHPARTHGAGKLYV